MAIFNSYFDITRGYLFWMLEAEVPLRHLLQTIHGPCQDGNATKNAWCSCENVGNVCSQAGENGKCMEKKMVKSLTYSFGFRTRDG